MVVALAMAAGGGSARGAAAPDLGAQLDCLRQRHVAVVAAHRGQPDPTAAENAMSSFRASLAAGVPFLEIDVATTSDGVLVLMHDDTLDRTTTGSGEVIDRTWAEIRRLKLKRAGGVVLDEGVPRLADVLMWGRKAGARFEVDVKKTTKWSAVIDAVRAARMEQQVLIVTYTLDDARKVHGLDPRLMMSVTMEKPEELEAATRAIPANRMLAWTGQQDPDAHLVAALREAGVEPILGTLGRTGERLDDLFTADGNPSEYRDLVREGIVMIASDRAVVAQRAIGFAYRGCLQAR